MLTVYNIVLFRIRKNRLQYCKMYFRGRILYFFAPPSPEWQSCQRTSRKRLSCLTGDLDVPRVWTWPFRLTCSPPWLLLRRRRTLPRLNAVTDILTVYSNSVVFKPFEAFAPSALGALRRIAEICRSNKEFLLWSRFTFQIVQHLYIFWYSIFRTIWL
jgi:hypothetical protein